MAPSLGLRPRLSLLPLALALLVGACSNTSEPAARGHQDTASHHPGHAAAGASGASDQASADEAIARVAAIHGGNGPWAVAGYRMGQHALVRLGLPPQSFDLEVIHHSPRSVQYSCIADGAAAATGASLGKLNLSMVEADEAHTETTYRRKSTGQAVTLRATSAFAARFRDLPREKLGEAGRSVMGLRDDEVFEQAHPLPQGITTVALTVLAGPSKGGTLRPLKYEAMQPPVGVPTKGAPCTVATVLRPLGRKITDTQAVPAPPCLHVAAAADDPLTIAALASFMFSSPPGAAVSSLLFSFAALATLGSLFGSLALASALGSRRSEVCPCFASSCQAVFCVVCVFCVFCVVCAICVFCTSCASFVTASAMGRAASSDDTVTVSASAASKTGGSTHCGRGAAAEMGSGRRWSR